VSYRTILSTPHARQRAKELIDQASDGWIAELRQPKRTTDQNDKMWAMLTDISLAEPEGRKLTPDEWKVLMLHACGWECQFLEGLDGRPFPKGFSSSKLTKAQMASLITFIQEYGDRHGVRWSDPQEQAA
jgi:hypothetical protein